MVRKIKFKTIFSRIFTLSYPVYRFFTFLTILILLRILPFYIIEKTSKLSICSAILGKYCFSVGITRGVSSLLRGNFSKAIEYNPLSVLVLILLVGFLFFDFYKGFIKHKNV